MHKACFRFAVCILQATTRQILSCLCIGVLWPIANAHANLMLTASMEEIKWLFLSLTCPESRLLTYPFRKTEYGKSSPRETECAQNRAGASPGPCWGRNLSLGQETAAIHPPGAPALGSVWVPLLWLSPCRDSRVLLAAASPVQG